MFTSAMKTMRILQSGMLKTKAKQTNTWWQKAYRISNFELYKVLSEKVYLIRVESWWTTAGQWLQREKELVSSGDKVPYRLSKSKQSALDIYTYKQCWVKWCGEGQGWFRCSTLERRPQKKSETGMVIAISQKSGR